MNDSQIFDLRPNKIIAQYEVKDVFSKDKLMEIFPRDKIFE
jgi:hypothetical protein